MTTQFTAKEQKLLAKIHTRHSPAVSMEWDDKLGSPMLGGVMWNPDAVMLALKDAYSAGKHAENRRLVKLKYGDKP